jgi:hypothetical protein
MAKVRGRPFSGGNQFGCGRPKGSKNRQRIWMQELLDGHGEALMKKCMLDALHGDTASMRLCMERLLAPRRDGNVQVALPRIKTLADVDLASERVLRAIQSGSITPAEGETMTNVIENRRSVIETVDLQTRVEKLEESASDADRKPGRRR